MRLTMISEADYRSICSRSSTESTPQTCYHGNGCSIDNAWNSDVLVGFRLDYDTEANTYFLVKYNPIILENGMVDDSHGQDILAYDSTNKELKILIDIESIAKETSIGSRSVVVMRFLREMLINHKNDTAGKNVYNIIRKKELLTQTVLANILKYYESIQSIEKLGDKFIESLRDETFAINTDGRDRHKTLNLPKKVVQFMDNMQADKYNRSDVSTYLKAFQKMMTGDGNELIAVIDYLEMYNQLSKKIPNQNGGCWNGAASPGSARTLVEKLGDIKEMRPDIDVRRVLNYLIKQHFNSLFTVGYANAKFDPIRFAATIPSRIAGIYCDYLQMNPTELFPQDLYKSHNIMALENKIVVSDEEAEKFHEYGTMLATRYNMNVGDYRFEVPTDYKKFVEIGKTFMNCLPTCGKAFYNGKCDIVFIYGVNDEIPKYALEMDQYADVVQAKTTRDMDISDDDVWAAIDQYVQKLHA